MVRMEQGRPRHLHPAGQVVTALQQAEQQAEAARTDFYRVAAKRVSHDSGIEEASARWTAAIQEVRRLKRNNR
jgi:hypothetical protein